MATLQDAPHDEPQQDPVLAATEARLQALAQAQQAAIATGQLEPTDPVVVEGKRKVYRAIEDELLDYKCVQS